ncbi:MAG: ATP-binding cassette domain-containing protein [Methylacidiphilales bacterium]|nr:ATP-binding cassette domain-containing protein [Candidatus Methylacidiphilales bacterium]
MSAELKKLVEMRGVKLKFADKMILDCVDFSMQPQEVLVIMGLSGGGKSTLLSLLMGLLKPDAGEIFFKEEDLTKLSRPKLNEARTHIGMVYQNAALISSMNVRENIALPLQELSDKNEKEIDSIVNQKLELVGLKDAVDKLPSELSGGMEKRVGLARALALEPELILFDEPSAGLDPINSKLINDLIIQLRDKQKATAIVVTHEMDSAFAVATRMAFLHEGKIILEGAPDEFRHSDNPIVSKFLSSYSNHEKTGE